MAMFPCAHMHLLPDDEQRNAMLQSMLAFLTDTVFIWRCKTHDQTGYPGLHSSRVRNNRANRWRATACCLSRPSARARSSSPQSSAAAGLPKQNHMLATRGVRNVLRHLGMLVDEPPTTREPYAAAPLRKAFSPDQPFN